MQLFTEEWICNETKLVFIYKDINDSEQPYFVYDGNDKDGYSYNSENYDYETNDTFKKILNNNYTEYQYVYDTNKLYINESLFMFCCACVSPCFENNYGRLLLTMVFREMLASMQDWYRKLKQNALVGISVEKIDNVNSFAVLVLNRAYKETCHCIEHFYAPIRFAYITSLSGEYYEKTGCKANLIFIPRSIDIIKKYSEIFSYGFRKEDQIKMTLSFENLRVIRKLSQIAQDDLCLLFHEDSSENFYATGICSYKKFLRRLEAKGEKIPYLNVKIKQHMDFDMFVGNTYIFSYRNGNHRIRYQIPNEYLKEICQKTFCNTENYNKVIIAINEAKKQTHGTMLVVLSEEDARKEAERLADRGFGIINNYSKSTLDIFHLSAIDGSIILDVNCVVYGIGMILDGDTNTNGDIAKGARHNSAYKYCNYLKSEGIKGLIFIVSEDGDVKLLIPD